MGQMQTALEGLSNLAAGWERNLEGAGPGLHRSHSSPLQPGGKLKFSKAILFNPCEEGEQSGIRALMILALH